MNTTLRQHIGHLAREFQAGRTARAIAAAVGIAEGVLDPDGLYDFAQRRIGYDEVQAGYIDSYEDEADAIDPDELFFGYGMSIDAFETYLALHEAFGAEWLLMGLHASGTRHPHDKIEVAHENFEIVCRRNWTLRMDHVLQQVVKLVDEIRHVAPA